MHKEIAIPLAYFITFTCYGTWLHGDRLMSVDRACNAFGTPFRDHDPIRARRERNLMSEVPYILDDVRRRIALAAIQEVCVFRKWSLLAAHVRSNHVHIVLHALINPEPIMNTFKSYLSRRLNMSGLDAHRINRWTRHGSTKYIWTIEEVEATIRYVVYEQGEAMAVFENKERKLELEPRE